MAFGFSFEHSGNVLADHQAGDADVATEVVVGHRDDAGIVATTRLDQRGDDRGTERAGENGNRCVLARRKRHRCEGRDPVADRHNFRRRALARRSVTVRRRTVDPSKEAGTGTGRLSDRVVVEFEFEGAGHADAVLVHLEPS